MQELVRQFRTAALERRGTAPGRGGRYPTEMRELGIRCFEEAQQRGLGLKATAHALGIDPDTLDTWRRRHVAITRARPQPVRITTDAQAARTGGRVAVHLPGGVTITGLDLDDAIDVVRRLA